jgi:hypothetical protein
MNEKTYDRIINEGGEGYNPYRAAREQAEMEAARNAPKTRSDRKYEILHKLEVKDCSMARECGTYKQDEIDALRAALKAIEDEETSEFLAAWPIELTKTRRASWNAWGQALKDSGAKISYKDLDIQEKKVGFTFADMKKAIQAHGL